MLLNVNGFAFVLLPQLKEHSVIFIRPDLGLTVARAGQNDESVVVTSIGVSGASIYMACMYRLSCVGTAVGCSISPCAMIGIWAS